MDPPRPKPVLRILLACVCLLAAPATTLFGRPGNVLDADVPIVPALITAIGAGCAFSAWRAARRDGRWGAVALLLTATCFAAFAFSAYVAVDHRLHPRYEYARLTGVDGCTEPPTRSTAPALAVGSLPDALVHQLSTVQPIWLVNEPHRLGRRTVVALHGQHNSFYAGIAGLRDEGWTNTERDAGRAEHRGVLRRGGTTIRYLTQGGQGLFCVGSDTRAPIGVMAEYVFTSESLPEGNG